MTIEAEIVVTLAEVEVTDDYRVQIALHERVQVLTITEATQLANELIAAVYEAQRAAEEDFPVVGGPSLHGFDVDLDAVTICRECREGKHGACGGAAVVIDVSDESLLKDCECAVRAHRSGASA